MDERGISPIVATILLIAVTVVAAGVIAAYVSGLYVGGGALRSASVVGATVYDYDDSAVNENYKNGNVSIVIKVDIGTYRNIADPYYGGTSVTVTNPATGYTDTISFPDNTNLWGSTLTASSTKDWPATGAADKITMIVSMTPDSRGRLVAGGAISLTLQFDNTDAHENASQRVDAGRAWDERDTLNVTITSRDSISLTGYDGAWLGGSAWTV